jgi:hypothetical protein
MMQNIGGQEHSTPNIKTKLTNIPVNPNSTSNTMPQYPSRAFRDPPIGLQDQNMELKKRRGEESSTKPPIKTVPKHFIQIQRKTKHFIRHFPTNQQIKTKTATRRPFNFHRSGDLSTNQRLLKSTTKIDLYNKPHTHKIPIVKRRQRQERRDIGVRDTNKDLHHCPTAP